MAARHACSCMPHLVTHTDTQRRMCQPQGQAATGSQVRLPLQELIRVPCGLWCTHTGPAPGHQHTMTLLCALHAGKHHSSQHTYARYNRCLQVAPSDHGHTGVPRRGTGGRCAHDSPTGAQLTAHGVTSAPGEA